MYSSLCRSTVVIMDLLVKDYLLTHTFRQLEMEHGVGARPNAKLDKWGLNYDQISARSGDPVSEQCRGLVVRPRDLTRFTDKNWEDVVVGEVDIVAWPMTRFYNFGDGAAAAVDWNDPGLRVYEKVDGTCIIMYWDELHQRWHAGTRGVNEADLPMKLNDLSMDTITFSELFWRGLATAWAAYDTNTKTIRIDPNLSIYHNTVKEALDLLDKDVTYVFELTGPHNQIVVNYPNEGVTLLAMRHVPSGKELSIHSDVLPFVRRPMSWNIKDPDCLVSFVDAADPAQLEGAVVCDSQFRRMKVKNKAWILASHAKDSVTSSPRNALECIILEKIDDVVPIVPKDVGDRLLDMQAKYAAYCKSIDTNFEEFRNEAAGNRKRYAEQVMLSHDWTGPYFGLWEGRARNAHEWFQRLAECGKLSSSSLDSILSRMSV